MTKLMCYFLTNDIFWLHTMVIRSRGLSGLTYTVSMLKIGLSTMIHGYGDSFHQLLTCHMSHVSDAVNLVKGQTIFPLQFCAYYMYLL